MFNSVNLNNVPTASPRTAVGKIQGKNKGKGIASGIAPIAGNLLATLVAPESEIAPVAGSILGKIGGNVISGQPMGQNLGEGVLVGGYGGNALKGLANIGEQKMADRALKETELLRNEFGSIRPQLQMRYGLGNHVNAVKELGYEPTASNFQEIADIGNTFHDATKKDILKMAGPVNLQNYSDIIKGDISKYLGEITPQNKESYRFLSEYEDESVKILGGRLGDELMKVEPEKAFKWNQYLGEKYGRLNNMVEKQENSPLGNVDPELKAQRDAARAIYDKSSDIIFGESANNVLHKVRGIAPENVALQLEQAGKRIDLNNPQHRALATKLASNLNNAPTMRDFRREESNFVNMSKLARMATRHKEQAVATPAALRAAKSKTKNMSSINLSDFLKRVGL